MGGVVGDQSGRDSFVMGKGQEWLCCVQRLCLIAITQPQAAYAALTKSLQCEWNYLQRVVPNCHSLFPELEEVMADQFLPTLLRDGVTSIERLPFVSQFAWVDWILEIQFLQHLLPIRFQGMPHVYLWRLLKERRSLHLRLIMKLFVHPEWKVAWKGK